MFDVLKTPKKHSKRPKRGKNIDKNHLKKLKKVENQVLQKGGG